MENTPIDIRFWMLSWIKTGSFMEFPWYTATFTNPRTGANPGITVSFYLEDFAGFVSERGSTRHASVKLLWTSCMSWDTCPWSKNDKFERPKSGKVNNWIAVVKRQTWFDQPKWLLFWESHVVAYRDVGWNSRKVQYISWGAEPGCMVAASGHLDEETKPDLEDSHRCWKQIPIASQETSVKLLCFSLHHRVACDLSSLVMEWCSFVSINLERATLIHSI